jgi:hypothetical protein
MWGRSGRRNEDNEGKESNENDGGAAQASDNPMSFNHVPSGGENRSRAVRGWKSAHAPVR